MLVVIAILRHHDWHFAEHQRQAEAPRLYC